MVEYYKDEDLERFDDNRDSCIGAHNFFAGSILVWPQDHIAAGGGDA